MSSSLLMTWQKCSNRRENAKKVWIKYLIHVTISIKKTEVIYQPAPKKPYKELTITVKSQRLQVVDKFTYLGSTLSGVVHIDDEINARIVKASAAFVRLRGSIWDRSGIRLDGDVPRRTSYGVYISQLIIFARASSNLNDFNYRNKALTAKLLRQGYR